MQLEESVYLIWEEISVLKSISHYLGIWGKPVNKVYIIIFKSVRYKYSLTNPFIIRLKALMISSGLSSLLYFCVSTSNMELSITTPALLFPAISLLMLAYTNRFLALASLIRNLHDKYKKDEAQKHIIEQLKNLRARIRMIRSMQAFGVLSFLFCVVCMFCIFRGWPDASYIVFAISIVCFIISLILSLMEISLSTRALELELSDMEELSRTGFFSEILRSKDE